MILHTDSAFRKLPCSCTCTLLACFQVWGTHACDWTQYKFGSRFEPMSSNYTQSSVYSEQQCGSGVDFFLLARDSLPICRVAQQDSVHETQLLLCMLISEFFDPQRH